jgi:hypothetical protein
MFIAISLISAFGVFEALAYRYGSDSRPFFDERPERGSHRIR